MKKFIALFALAAVLAVSGCNSGNGGNETTTAATTTTEKRDAETTTAKTKKSGEVTEIAMQSEEKPDTTEGALEFLETAAKPFRRYLDLRRKTPLTFESTVTSGGQEWKSCIYIKDNENFAQYSKDPNGYTLTIVYKKDKIYQVDDVRKSIYTYNCGEDDVKDSFDTLSLRIIYEEDVKNCDYEVGEKEYKGKTYDFVTITENGSDTTQYFDKDTGILAYTVEGEEVTKVDKFENTFTNDSILELPSDYEMKTITDLYNEQAAEAAEQQGGIDVSE